MLRVVVTLLASFVIANASIASVSAADSGKFGVAAVVNGQEIKSDKLQKAVDAHLQQKGTNIGAIRDPNRYKEVREEVLDVLIGQNLLWQSAKKNKLLASDEEVDQLYKQYVAQYPSEDEFKARMKIEGYTEKSYREELRQQLSARKYVQEKIVKTQKVDIKEIDTFYNENKEKFKTPELVHARHILITLDQNADKKQKKEARALLKKLKKEVADGADFAELAKKHSRGPSAPNGGDLGFFDRGKMVKPFEDAAFKLKPGEVSDIVETQFGYHLIKMEEKQPSRVVPKEEIAGRIEGYLLQVKYEESLNKEIERLKQDAKIEKFLF
jgi:peptidyl-prolyl cis-trans isomerase C